MKKHLVHTEELNLGDGNLEVIELEEGDLILTAEERKHLAEELTTHYVSYNKPILRELVKKICHIL